MNTVSGALSLDGSVFRSIYGKGKNFTTGALDGPLRRGARQLGRGQHHGGAAAGRGTPAGDPGATGFGGSDDIGADQPAEATA